MTVEEQGITVLFYTSHWFGLDNSVEMDIIWKELDTAPKDKFEKVGMEDDIAEIAGCSQVDKMRRSHASIPLSSVGIKRLVCRGLGMVGYHHNGRVIIWRDNRWVELRDDDEKLNCGIVSRDFVEDVFVNINQYF